MEKGEAADMEVRLMAESKKQSIRYLMFNFKYFISSLPDCGVFCMRFAEGYTRRGSIDFCQADMLHYRKQICLELFDLEVPVYLQ